MSERKTIYLCLAHMSEEGIEQKYVKEAFDTNWVVPLGPNVNGFEEDLKQFVGGNQMILTDEYAGFCLMYAAVHGEEDKINMQNPKDQEQFEADFNELMGF